VAQRDLAAVADKQLNPEGGQNRVTDLVCNREVIVSQKDRDEEEEHDCDQDHLPLDKGRLPPGMVGPVVFVVDAAG
jgi:hypothetical protein